MSRTLLLLLLAVSPAIAGDMPAALDLAARPRLLDTHFARYGPAALRTVGKCPGGVRLNLPADPKRNAQTGLYSYFAAAGDFDLVATFELLNLPAPQGGYGASVGLAADAEAAADGGVVVQRGHHPDHGASYWVTRVRAGASGPEYDTTFHPAKAKFGRLSLRREKAEVVCLVADGPSEHLKELARLPFTVGTVRPLRVFADAGGSPTPVDVRVTAMSVRADELAGGIPEIGRAGDWWPAGVAASVAVLAGAWWWRRRRNAN